jgi:MraZ protein
MFLGEYQHNLDSKGRVAIPSKFRQQLSGKAIITRGLDRCLFVFTSKEWEIFAQKIVALPIARSDSRAFTRLMLAEATDVDVDKQGRVLIPNYLREYAHLKKEAVVTGLYNRFEIWNLDSWKEYKAKTEASGDDIAEKLGELGI